jgi:Acetyltransferase (GNAT) domain
VKVQPQPISASFYTPFLSDQFEVYTQNLPVSLQIQKFNQYLYLPEASWTDSSLRRNLQKAARSQVRITQEVTNERIRAFWEIYQQNCQDYEIPLKPQAVIEQLLQSSQTDPHVQSYFALYEDAMIGGLIVLWGPRTVSYYAPCSLASARTVQAGPALINHAIEAARAHGILYWNWEASPDRSSGVYRFKQKWGSTESYYRIYIVPFQTSDFYRQLGPTRLAAEFPYFFVYPYDQLLDSLG